MEGFFEAGTKASTHRSLNWEVKLLGRAIIHDAVIERTGFLTKCGLTIDPRKSEARPLQIDLRKNLMRCMRCNP